MTTLFLATTGGHLDQLLELSGRLPAGPGALWVTHANAQSRSVLADREAVFVPYVRGRNVADVARCVPTADRLWRERRITQVVTTGSGIALGFLPYLAMRGVECHYIESAARVSGPSLTGRVLGATPGVRLYTQYQGWARGRWRYGGSVFDHYEPVDGPRTDPNGVLRVVVMTGTATEFPFRRLVARLVPLLAPGGTLERVTGRPVKVRWQTGCTPVADLPIRSEPFLPAHELASTLAEADLVVSHAGTGSALSALRAGRAPLLVCRVAVFGEAADDHQRELAGELRRRRIASTADADTIGADDLLRAVGAAVRRSTTPDAFELAS